MRWRFRGGFRLVTVLIPRFQIIKNVEVSSKLGVYFSSLSLQFPNLVRNGFALLLSRLNPLLKERIHIDTAWLDGADIPCRMQAVSGNGTHAEGTGFEPAEL